MSLIDKSLSTEGLSLYRALGLEKGATESEVKKAYYKKALKCHPDKNPEPSAAEEFKTISKANDVLRDEKKRKIYDKLGSRGMAISDQIGVDNTEMLIKYDRWYWKLGVCLIFCGTGKFSEL